MVLPSPCTSSVVTDSYNFSAMPNLHHVHHVLKPGPNVYQSTPLQMLLLLEVSSNISKNAFPASSLAVKG